MLVDGEAVMAVAHHLMHALDVRGGGQSVRGLPSHFETKRRCSSITFQKGAFDELNPNWFVKQDLIEQKQKQWAGSCITVRDATA
jgi:hypothetical protein